MARPRRFLTGLALAAAAAASIATSAPIWQRDDEMPLEVAVLDPAVGTTSYIITGELVGPIGSDRVGGDLYVSLSVGSFADGALLGGTVKVTLRQQGVVDPIIVEDTMTLAGGAGALSLSAEAWTSCTASPCVESWELTLSEVAPARAIEVAGTVRLYGQWWDEPQEDYGVRVLTNWIGPLP